MSRLSTRSLHHRLSVFGGPRKRNKIVSASLQNVQWLRLQVDEEFGVYMWSFRSHRKGPATVPYDELTTAAIEERRQEGSKFAPSTAETKTRLRNRFSLKRRAAAAHELDAVDEASRADVLAALYGSSDEEEGATVSEPDAMTRWESRPRIDSDPTVLDTLGPTDPFQCSEEEPESPELPPNEPQSPPRIVISDYLKKLQREVLGEPAEPPRQVRSKPLPRRQIGMPDVAMQVIQRQRASTVTGMYFDRQRSTSAMSRESKDSSPTGQRRSTVHHRARNRRRMALRAASRAVKEPSPLEQLDNEVTRVTQEFVTWLSTEKGTESEDDLDIAPIKPKHEYCNPDRVLDRWAPLQIVEATRVPPELIDDDIRESMEEEDDTADNPLVAPVGGLTAGELSLPNMTIIEAHPESDSVRKRSLRYGRPYVPVEYWNRLSVISEEMESDDVEERDKGTKGLRRLMADVAITHLSAAGKKEARAERRKSMKVAHSKVRDYIDEHTKELNHRIKLRTVGAGVTSTPSIRDAAEDEEEGSSSDSSMDEERKMLQRRKKAQERRRIVGELLPKARIGKQFQQFQLDHNNPPVDLTSNYPEDRH